MQDLFLFISEHIVLVSFWFFCLIMLFFSSTKNIFIQSKIINNIQAIKLINEDKAIVFDTRTAEIFKTGHIINSINIPLENIFLGNVNQIKKYKIFPIILILNNTYEYNKCMKELLKHGFKNVYILKNGLYDWNLENLPLFVKKIDH
ncbi:rhodanese-like domain-containing protein [Buchnera aphidicola]|uniref:Putative rhodanese-related sulfurtransferase n=1 Tax=Buchnera aphidicola str. Ua (Uroleucon ambrosiae) TaxID=1005057 RepID=G2LNU1_BUCUM|nr:rhodanese-like domain-containing protein [Buchnera aphidicola]AEO07878.1 putative rhodanese-related sulfurtransferase [Buchnera aphidicola str. Ua (Uroleucon ambrosiae)]